MEDQRDRGRFAGTGRSQDREMLAEHRVDVERAADVVGRIDGADLDMRLVARREDRAQVVGRDREHVGARDRIAGHAAAEIAHLAGGVAAALAEEVDVGDDLAAVVGAQRADVGDQPVVADDHLDLAADLARHGDRRVLVRLQRGQSSRRRCGFASRSRRSRRPCRSRASSCRFAPGAGAASLVGEAADFVEEFAQVRLFVHVLTHSSIPNRAAQGLRESG